MSALSDTAFGVPALPPTNGWFYMVFLGLSFLIYKMGMKEYLSHKDALND